MLNQQKLNKNTRNGKNILWSVLRNSEKINNKLPKSGPKVTVYPYINSTNSLKGVREEQGMDLSEKKTV
jgi:hypothetical protein